MGRASAVLAALVVVSLGAPGTAAAAPCTLWAHPDGNDRADGTPRAPLRTISALTDRLAPGQTGCLAGGQRFREQARIAKGGLPGRPTRLQGNGALLQGGIAIRANDVVVGGLRIHGLGERRSGVVVVQGARVSILRNEIVGKDIVRWTPCILLDGATATTIDGNVIQECTKTLSRTVHAQGIFVKNSSATTIANNIVARTSGDGIVITNAQRTLVARNHVHGNTNGVYLAPGSVETAVVDNVISFSGRHNVYGVGGPDNLVTGNCLWKGFAGNVVGSGFTAVANLVTSPRYANRFRSLSMRPGPCARRKPVSLRRAGASIGTSFPQLPRFRVHYRLLGLPRRVKVVRLNVTRLLPGAVVRVRCLQGCRASERRAGSAAGRASFGNLRGRWLGRGTVVELRATRPGWGGHVARVRVVGLPKGVRVGHLCTQPGSRRTISCTRLSRR